MVNRYELDLKELINQEESSPEKVALDVSLREVYLNLGEIDQQEELKMITVYDALIHVLNLPDLLKYIREKLKKDYFELEHLGFPPQPWQTFSQKVLGIYVANLAADPEKEIVTSRFLPLRNQSGEKIKSAFLYALAIKREKINPNNPH